MAYLRKKWQSKHVNLLMALAIALLLIFSSFVAWAGNKQSNPSSPIPPGSYECQIDISYKFRPCEVVRDTNRQSTLRIPEGGLLALEGSINQEVDWILVEGRLTEARPFGCFSCQERCSQNPNSCECKELLPQASAECKIQPLHLLLRASGKGNWSGVLPYLVYYNKYQNGKIIGYERQPDLYKVTIRQKP